MPYLSDFLSEETKNTYEVIDHFTGEKLTGTESQAKSIAVGKFPKTDLTKLSAQSAHNLVKQGFPILITKEKFAELQAAKNKKKEPATTAPVKDAAKS